MKIYIRPGDWLLVHLSEAVSRADAERRSLRIEIGDDNVGRFIKWKVGEGIWTGPFYCDYPDPNVSPYYGQGPVPDTFLQDDGHTQYVCDSQRCGYNGDAYCSNCGYDRDGN